MFVSYFSEQPMNDFDLSEADKRQPDDHPSRPLGDIALLFSNKFFDPQRGARLYRERLEEIQLAEEVGFDGAMTNEHHDTPLSMANRCNIMSAFVAAKTERIKIVQLGNPLPFCGTPIQLAEEIAMLDLMSNGRIVAGFVRGGGRENLANNTNPVFNRDCFYEAAELIVEAWTRPGPFSWDGDQYQLRIVNPWVLPMQKPHPRIWVPGVASLETIDWAAEHAYPYVCLSTSLDITKQIWQRYDTVAAANGYQAGPQHRGYLMRAHVADDEETARRNAAEYVWMGKRGMANVTWNAPPGYSNRAARAKLLQAYKSGYDDLDKAVEMGTIIYGTPDQVIKQMRRWLEETRPGILTLWANDGRVSHADSLRCIELMGREVLPAIREIGAELELHDPFSIDAPVSLTHANNRNRTATYA